MGKKWDRFQHLDEGEYWREICAMSAEQLKQEHKTLQQNIVSSGAAGGASVAAGFFTFGAAWVGTAIAARRLNVNSRQCTLVEKRLKELDAEGYKFRKRDFAYAVGPCCVAELVVPAGGALLGHAGQIAAHHGATVLGQHAAIAAKQHTIQTLTQHAAKEIVTAQPAHAVAAVATHTTAFVDGAVQGVQSEVSKVTLGVLGHATNHAANLMPVDLATQQAGVMGAAAGQMAATEGANKLLSYAAKETIKAAVVQAGSTSDKRHQRNLTRVEQQQAQQRAAERGLQEAEMKLGRTGSAIDSSHANDEAKPKTLPETELERDRMSLELLQMANERRFMKYKATLEERRKQQLRLDQSSLAALEKATNIIQGKDCDPESTKAREKELQLDKVSLKALEKASNNKTNQNAESNSVFTEVKNSILTGSLIKKEKSTVDSRSAIARGDRDPFALVWETALYGKKGAEKLQDVQCTSSSTKSKEMPIFSQKKVINPDTYDPFTYEKTRMKTEVKQASSKTSKSTEIQNAVKKETPVFAKSAVDGIGKSDPFADLWETAARQTRPVEKKQVTTVVHEVEAWIEQDDGDPFADDCAADTQHDVSSRCKFQTDSRLIHSDSSSASHLKISQSRQGCIENDWEELFRSLDAKDQTTQDKSPSRGEWDELFATLETATKPANNM